jgi:hypothetical protein
MSATKGLLVLFATLTVAFAAVSVYEYFQLGAQRATSSGQTTTQPSQATQPLSSSSSIQILNGNTFETFCYVQWNSSTPSTFTIANVKFALWTNTTITYSGGHAMAPQVATVVMSSHFLMALPKV